jgi:hypothetical protein
MMANRCAGTQNGPCPQDRCDSSVKFTIYDLFLCPQCARVRENAQLPAVNDRADNSVPPAAAAAVPKKGRKVKNPPTSTKPEQRPIGGSDAAVDGLQAATTTIADAFSGQVVNNRSALSLTNSQSSGSDPQLHAANVCADDVTALHQIIKVQQNEIVKLKHQLNYVLSFLGIADSIEDAGHDAALTPPEIAPETEPTPGAHHSPAHGDNNEQGLWSKVTSKRQHRSDSFQQSVVAAVYVDQSLQKQRESSLIVTGLQPVAGTSGNDLFLSLCLAEFNTRPEIVTTRRLGHSKPSKSQPLLVYLKQTEQAQYFINHAKSLRHSSNVAVRDKVFINRNMTRAEAVAAYQIRLQRRQAQERRQQSPNTESSSTTDQAAHSGPPAADKPSVGPALLNPSADAFIPSPSSSVVLRD